MPDANRKAVRSAVAAARKQSPAREDPALAAVRQARIGPPAQVYSPAGIPVFWLVPLLTGTSASGFAHVDLVGQVIRLGTFGAGPEDRASWIPATFFEAPPAETLSEIRTRYGGADLSEPILSYDTTPVRWAWRLAVFAAGSPVTEVFITPSGWYERKPVSNRENLER